MGIQAWYNVLLKLVAGYRNKFSDKSIQNFVKGMGKMLSVITLQRIINSGAVPFVLIMCFCPGALIFGLGASILITEAWNRLTMIPYGTA